MANDPPCPAPSALKRLLDAALPEAEQTELARHLEMCPACQQRLQDLAAGGASWEALAGHLHAAKHGRGEALEHAMDKLRADKRNLPTEDEVEEREEIALDFLDPPNKPRQLGKFDHYEIVEILGSGGMGIVFKALDPALHRIVAVKVMAPQLAAIPSARQRFLREARAAAAVCHEHVVTIHAVGEAKGLPYLVMQFVSGLSLQDRLEKRGPLNLDEILRIGTQTAQGLAAAHAQGLVHRDIKPANILLENGVERVKITDFGLARAVGAARITQSGVIVGTPQYMAPEQGRGEVVDFRADLFSLGSVLYFMCTGQPPFEGESSLAVIRRVCDAAPPPIPTLNPNVPEWLVALIDRLQAKQPQDRFATAAEVAEVLKQHLVQLQSAARTPPPLSDDIAIAEPIWVPDAARTAWKKWFMAVGGLIVLAAIGFFAFFFRAAWFPPPTEKPPSEVAANENPSNETGKEGNSRRVPQPSIPSPHLPESKVEVRLPEPFALVRSGGEGRYLVFHLKRSRKLAIFDASATRVVKEIDLPSDNVLFACGREKLMVVLPVQHLIQRWNLQTFVREKSVAFPTEQPVLQTAMGNSSTGPLYLWSGDKVEFFDVEKMQLFPVEGEGIQARPPGRLEMRVSADGRTVVAWTPHLSPIRYKVMRWHGDKVTTLQSSDRQGANGHWAMPNADGSLIFCDGSGIYPASMKTVVFDGDKDGVLLPTDDPRFFLRVRKQLANRDEATICLTADRRSLWTVAHLESTTTARNPREWVLAGAAPRLRYFPSANLLLLLPESNDRVIVRTFDLFAALDRDARSYLFVLSAPPTRARAGTEYVYPLEVRSKAGGVRLHLESGPEGMTLAEDRLRWHVPLEREGQTVNVLVAVRDASGQEIQHAFDIAIE